ncbi:Sperm-associated antigen 6 [Hypsibius exemplaris]|uniref:Sperm-associated antigen 6 n=1 Tax=Hypsibius exemplaris TaxID=2072580 RepID=A0A9X6NPI8_HYPEX|nr:Sperm-associated antigen 6 [Hypsibius exemplaris]
MNGRVLNQRQISQVFEDYHRAQTTFVQTISELASRSKNIEFLQQEGVMALLRPLLLDMRPNIQYMAAMALGRLAENNADLAAGVVTGDILPQVVYGLAKNGTMYRRAACYIMKSIAKHGPELAQSVVASGGAAALVMCLDSPELALREQATEALGCVARHNSQLAQSVVDAGAGPLLVFCLREPEASLKRAAVSTMADICKHSPELAQTIVDTGAVPYMAKMINSDDVRSKRQVFAALSHICKHSLILAEVVMDADVLPNMLVSMRDRDEKVAQNCAGLLREFSKHNEEMAQMVVNSGGIGATVEYLKFHRGPACVPAHMTLGYLASHSETVAAAIILAKALPSLQATLKDNEEESFVKAAAVWAIGQLAGHSSEHATAICSTDIVTIILGFTRGDAGPNSEDLRNKSRKTLKSIIDKCIYLPTLDMLLEQGPPGIKDAVILQYCKILPHDAKSRRAFVVNGGLKYIQQLDVDRGTPLWDAIEAVNACYPPDIVKYFSPGYTEQLLEKVDRFAPNRSDYEKFFQNATQGQSPQLDKSRTDMPAATA